MRILWCDITRFVCPTIHSDLLLKRFCGGLETSCHFHPQYVGCFKSWNKLQCCCLSIYFFYISLFCLYFLYPFFSIQLFFYLFGCDKDGLPPNEIWIDRSIIDIVCAYTYIYFIIYFLSYTDHCPMTCN